MNSVYQHWEAPLQAAGFTRASEKPGRFFRRLSEHTAFVLNLVWEEPGLEVIFGLASIAVNAEENGLLDYFARVGFDPCDCIVRFSRSLSAPEEVPALQKAVADCLRQYGGCSKAELLAISREKREQFFALISAVLRPLGFRKKGNKWMLHPADSFLFEVWAQKSAWSDQYYLNISVFPDGAASGDCFQTRITAGTADCFDWQLIPPAFWNRLLQKAADELLMPLLQADPRCIRSMLQASRRWVRISSR